MQKVNEHEILEILDYKYRKYIGVHLFPFIY